MPKGALSVKAMLLRYDFFLARGRFYQPQPLPKGYRRRKLKQCFDNSYKLAACKEGLTYCEGYVAMAFADGVTGIEHGWCVTPDRKVIDATLREPGLSYFGVTHSLKALADVDELPVIDQIITDKLTKRVRRVDRA